MPPSSPHCAPHKVWDPSGTHSTCLYRPPFLSHLLLSSPSPFFVSPSLSSPSLPSRAEISVKAHACGSGHREEGGKQADSQNAGGADAHQATLDR